MKICPSCERIMARDTSSGSVRFRCYCGVEVEGLPHDALIASETQAASRNTEMYRRIIQSSAHSRVNQQVMRDCSRCGLDYMTQIRVSEQEVVVWTCRCGNEESGANLASV